jgi:hypothetical protein
MEINEQAIKDFYKENKPEAPAQEPPIENPPAQEPEDKVETPVPPTEEPKTPSEETPPETKPSEEEAPPNEEEKKDDDGRFVLEEEDNLSSPMGEEFDFAKLNRYGINAKNWDEFGSQITELKEKGEGNPEITFANDEVKELVTKLNDIATNGGDINEVFRVRDEKKGIQEALASIQETAKADPDAIALDWLKIKHKNTPYDPKELLDSMEDHQKASLVAEALANTEFDAQKRIAELEAKENSIASDSRKNAEMYSKFVDESLKTYEHPHIRIGDSHRQTMEKVLKSDMATFVLPKELGNALYDGSGQLDLNKVVELVYGEKIAKSIRTRSANEVKQKEFLKQTGATPEEKAPKTPAPIKDEKDSPEYRKKVLGQILTGGNPV